MFARQWQSRIGREAALNGRSFGRNSDGTNQWGRQLQSLSANSRIF